MKIRFGFYILLFVALGYSMPLLAQRKIQQIDPEKENEETTPATKGDFWEKTSFGGNVGARFSNQETIIALQPLLFHQLNDKTTLGGGVSYVYFQQNIILPNGQTQKNSSSSYGLNLFARQQIFNPLFVHAEYSPMNFEVYQPVTGDYKREWVSALYLGGGINQRVSNRSGFYVMLLYNVLYDQNRTITNRPVEMRIGFYL